MSPVLLPAFVAPSVATPTDLVGRLKAALENSDPSLPGHVVRVGRLAARLGAAVGLDESDCATLELGGVLHDVGKLFVPARILQLNRRLLVEEQEVIRHHAERGAVWLEERGFGQGVIDIARHHHERWDGGGYPMGLAGTEIPALARVLAVADVWDALRSPRPYKRALPWDVAEGIVRKESGRAFEPLLVEALFATLPRPPG